MKSYMSGEENGSHDRESEALRMSDMLRWLKLVGFHPVVRVCDPVKADICRPAICGSAIRLCGPTAGLKIAKVRLHKSLWYLQLGIYVFR